MEQVGIAHVTIHDVRSVVRVLVISPIEVIITRDINDLHVSGHERNTAISWKANEEVELLAQPFFFRIVEQKVVKPLFFSLRGTSQSDRCRPAFRFLHESGHVFIRKKPEPGNGEVLVLNLLEIACIANKYFFICSHLLYTDEVVVVWRVSDLIKTKQKIPKSLSLSPPNSNSASSMKLNTLLLPIFAGM